MAGATALWHSFGSCDAVKGVSFSTRGSKDHNLLVHNGCQQSFGSKYYKRLVPTCCRHSFWSQDDECMVPAAVGTQSGGLPQPEGEAPSLPEGGAWVRDSYCIPAVSICLGAKMASG